MNEKCESGNKKTKLKKLFISTIVSCGIGYAFYKLPMLFADKIYYYNTKKSKNDKE